jgi:hypothetical protein
MRRRRSFHRLRTDARGTDVVPEVGSIDGLCSLSQGQEQPSGTRHDDKPDVVR